MTIKEGYISSADMEIINREVMAESFPWYYCEESTTNNFPFLNCTVSPGNASNLLI